MTRSRAVRLEPRRVAKPWGRRDLSPWSSDAADADDPVGELWFEDPDGDGGDLLVKLLFTAARLSVQVHPDDAAAHAAGLPRGKDEAWVVLGTRPPAEIAVGLAGPVDATLRAAALDGSIVDRLDWRRVAVGDAFYSPAGTVHAIGAGLILLEVQQNADVTYRLFDYGSGRRLDLDAALAVARAGSAITGQRDLGRHRTLVASGPKLQIERFDPGSRAVRLDPAGTGRLWVFAASGAGRIDNIVMFPGTCVAVDAACTAAAPGGADWLVAYARPAPADWLAVHQA